jgi:hypothetical protein
MDKDKGKKNKTGTGRTTAMRKATPDERKAVRATGARKLARTEGKLAEIYSEEKGGRTVLSKNSGTTAARTNTKSLSGKKSTADAGSYGSSVGKNKKESIARTENDSFYGDTKLGRRIATKAAKKGGAGLSGGYTKTGLKKRFTK